MLVEFQQALADLVSSPEMCRRARKDPDFLKERYDISDREYRRLVMMVNHDGMACNCMLYRANRLAPLAINLYGFCKALGPRLGDLLSEYAGLYPNTNVHFYLECDRFCRFIAKKIGEGYYLEPEAQAIFNEEFSRIELGLVASYTNL
jgi:hypothetical protein